jgi:hypothetical protein
MWGCLLVEDSAYERWVRLSHELERSVITERKERTKKRQSLLVWVFSLVGEIK